MRKVKELEINYKAYTHLLIKQKFLSFLLGLGIVFVTGLFIFNKLIISNFAAKNHKKVAQRTEEVRKYIVQEGEDLWQIAEKNYGSGYNSYDIAHANNLKEPYILQKGQILIIPHVAKRFPTQGDIIEPAPSTSQVTLKGTTYTVQEGDFLFQIAQKAYGDGNMTQRIIDANNIPPPYNIEVGQKLTIPR